MMMCQACHSACLEEADDLLSQLPASSSSAVSFRSLWENSDNSCNNFFCYYPFCLDFPDLVETIFYHPEFNEAGDVFRNTLSDQFYDCLTEEQQEFVVG